MFIAHGRGGVVDDRRQRQRAGGNRQADEIAIVGFAGHDVESRQAQRAADEKKKRDRAAEVAEGPEAPGVDEHGRRGAERDAVGERVVFLAEFARGAELTRDQSIKRVENCREEKRQTRELEELNRQIVAPVRDGFDTARAVDDGAESEKKIQDRERRRNDVDAAPKVFSNVGSFHPRSSISPMMVSPTFTFSRILMLILAVG